MAVMKTACLALALLFIVPISVALAADTPRLDDFTLEIAAKIKARERTLKTFEARFDQIQKSQLFENIVHSRGIIRYDADGRLLFQVTEPTPYAVVFDRDWVYILDPSQNRIKKRHVGRNGNIIKKFFGVGQPLEDLTRRFDVKATSNAPLPGVTLAMRPREARLAERISLISADVDDKTWLPVEIFIQQAHGDWTRMHLDFTAVNRPLPPDAFDIEGANLKKDKTPGDKEAP